MEAGDLHVWAFNGRRGHIVTITVRSTDFNPEIFLYGSNSSFITYNDDYEGNTNPTINELELEGFGQYVITIESRSVLTGGLYTISLNYGEGS